MATLKRKATAAILLAELIQDYDKKVTRGKTRRWMKRRPERGYFSTLIMELSAEDSVSFKEMMRMSKGDYLYILKQIERDITPKKILGGNEVINAKARLAVTLRFFATGETFRSLSFQFRISRAGISYIVLEVCKAIVRRIGKIHLQTPRGCEEWLNIAKKFENRWNYPNCIGAVDGKHVVIQPPANSGSMYYNYKQTHSIVLMAVAGPDYECLFADVGTNGRVSDGGVWNKCTLAQKLCNDELHLPPPKCLPFGIEKIPYVFVADSAFALKPNIMKPYPQSALTEDKRVYNYRHSRARRISENLFGIIVNRWRVLRSVIFLPPNTVEHLVLAILSLHNYLRRSGSRNIYCPPGLTDVEDRNGNLIEGSWRQSYNSSSIQPIRTQSVGNNASINAKQIRDTFKDYFSNEGAIPWQWDKY